MSHSSSIEWTSSTWNPVTGCSRVSTGCDNCYAVRQSYRNEAMGSEKYAGLTVLNKAGERHFNGKIRCDEESLMIPLRWKKPRRVFVNSMSDLFHKDVPFEFIDKVFAVMALCPQHTFQILTKRLERMAEYLHGMANECSGGCICFHGIHNVIESQMTDETIERLRKFHPFPLSNVWLGTSVEDQQTADERIPHLLRCPASVRFLSCEPLLGAIDLRHVDADLNLDALYGWNPNIGPEGMNCSRIDWVIVGGESGPGARPMHHDWVTSVRDQCTAANVPFFFKQWGAYGPGSVNMITGERVFRAFTSKQQWINKASTWVNGGVCVDLSGNVLRRGADFDCAEYPVIVTHKLGKKAAGRLLDGREWNQMPAQQEASHV